MRAFLNDERGNIAIIGALTFPLVVAGAGFGAETGFWYFSQTKLQQSADAAAYAATIEHRGGADIDAIRAAALSAATKNGFDSGSDVLEVENPTIVGSSPDENAVSVTIRRRQPRFFSAMFNDEPVVISVDATATYSSSANACIVALDKSASAAVDFGGNTSAVFNGCVIMSNSMASDAAEVQGSATVSTPCLITVGGVNIHSGLSLTSCTAPITDSSPAADPFRNVPEPADSGPCLNSTPSMLYPGRYCGGMNIKGSTTLQPGIYIVSGGELRINAKANVVGSGVTFYLTGNASVNINGNATLNLSAPTSGDYSGILFMGDDSNTDIGNTFNGTATSKMTGSLYFPSQAVDYLGNFSGNNGCMRVVAKTVTWSGSTTVNVDCTDQGMDELTVGGLVRLVK